MKCEKSKKIISCLSNFCQKKNLFLEKFVAPTLLLVLRIFIAGVFFKSGMVKFSNMESTIYLFENEYHLPLLSPIFAAYFTTFIELTFSILLVIGLATRLAALVFMGMTLTIQFLVIQNHEHFYWLIILATILCFGSGFLSFDRIIKRFCSDCKDK
jgi:putative oxidoreductase